MRGDTDDRRTSCGLNLVRSANQLPGSSEACTPFRNIQWMSVL
jgi:hypothetical protein